MLAPVTAAPLTDDDRYALAATRDRRWRDAFVLGVETTGIYCRPGCPARLPLRRNVRFFDTVEQARAAGFRACKRCRPDEAGSPHAEAVARACRSIEAAEAAPTLESLAAEAGLSPFHFHRVFKAGTGVTPAQYAAAIKDRRAKAAMAEGASVTEALFDAGYGSASRFYDRAEDRFGMAPARWRKGGADERILIATAPCAFGHVLVGATERGLCAVELGDDPTALRADFQRRFAAAQAVDHDPGLERLLAEVVALIEQPGRACDLPLDVRGTAFQQRVWDALRRIPAGETWTYAQLAEAVGAPRAVRAVGAACGANRVAVVIPCHRVVGSDGKLTGYRWGVDAKRALIERELAAL
ncbi:MAG TPA: bifunctional DNA-binding transcriptional regulator/O6-methylguanine-DNA methyltransferase Ada [Caulobacteraceae bacterium]|nr:bifunctional DNA-binding transcriptional regulator/O6-methylguanine-DNA methyltransferase Ada [Caulobacteraceae bacterium]